MPYKKVTMYLAAELADLIHHEAGILNKSKFSRFIMFKLFDGFDVLKKIKSLEEITADKKYSKILAGFGLQKVPIHTGFNVPADTRVIGSIRYATHLPCYGKSFSGVFEKLLFGADKA